MVAILAAVQKRKLAPRGCVGGATIANIVLFLVIVLVLDPALRFSVENEND